MATKLLLNAALESTSLDSGAGQLRVTGNVESSTPMDAGSANGSAGAPETTQRPQSIREEEVVNAVTMAASKRARVAESEAERIAVVEVYPDLVMDEFERLSLINVTCDKVRSDDCIASVSGLQDVSTGILGGGVSDDVPFGVDAFVGGNVSVGNVVSDGNDFSVSKDVSVLTDMCLSTEVSVDRDESSSIVSGDASVSKGVIVDLQSA